MTPKFYEKCYAVLKKVPKGKVTTYKEIARVLNSKAYRAVGTAMNKNPYAPIVPCHRVVNSDGKVGGFFSGKNTKIKLLKSEGVDVLNSRLDLKKYFYKLK
jgi:methylated-DNA-[protein]-cysteine S-methyltransferase